MELSADRPSGFGPAPIPAASIDRYATRYGLEGDDYEKLRTILRDLDTVFLERARAKQQNKPESSDKDAFPTQTSTKPMDKALFDTLFSKGPK